MNMARYNVNSRFFTVRSISVAYWLGFIFADGCVFTRRNGREWLLQVKLQRGDEGHLERLRSDLRYTGPIKYPVEDAAALCIYCRELCQDLVRLGIIPNKTKKGISIPEEWLEGLELPFAQGLFDANGSISEDKNGVKIGISGPRGIASWFRTQVAIHVRASARGHMTDRSPCFEVAWHGNRIGPEILSWLYQDSGTPRLIRKAQRAKATLEVYH